MALAETLRSRMLHRQSYRKSKRTAKVRKDDNDENKSSRRSKQGKTRFLASKSRTLSRKKRNKCSSISNGGGGVKPLTKRTKSCSEEPSFVGKTLKLRDLLTSEQCLSLFLAFCRSQFNSENLLFWLNAESFRLLANEEQAKRLGVPLTKQQILSRAIEVYNRFLKQDAEDWVCLRTDTADRITILLRDTPENVTSTIFNTAQEETLRTVENDIIPRFIESTIVTGKFETDDSVKSELRSLLRDA